MVESKSGQGIKRRKVTFSLESTDADEVIVTGDFNNWDPKKHPMEKDENGNWIKTVMVLPGKYEYKFLVDGQWKEDPKNKELSFNCFGTYNNILNVIAK